MHQETDAYDRRLLEPGNADESYRVPSLGGESLDIMRFVCCLCCFGMVYYQQLKGLQSLLSF